ncbi:MAG: SGNH/GDSL hydrolase family protein [Planctomycetota bacterium]|nr:MAG: SGNH/GDSL hydrolase family protein [Planctomycetota bacterium]
MNCEDANKSKSTNRRHFLKKLAHGAALGVAGSMMAEATHAEEKPAATPNINTAPKKKMKTIHDLIDKVVLQRDDIDGFLDPNAPNWAAFDPELGYVLHDSVQKDGLDGSWTIYRYGKKYGERKVINFADMSCRLNTYGDSFTQCHQVSDGETWQEYLAAHLGEPIRNFGVGGYGVYQAYRRLLRTEKTQIGTPYVILNIWGTDDHYRSLDSWRYPRCYTFFSRRRDAHIFHANPWDHIGFDLQTGKVVEKKNVCPTPASLYNLCDKEFIYETFKDDPAINIHLGSRMDYEVNTGLLKQLAEALGLSLDFSTPAKRAASTRTLYWECARRSTMWILDKVQEFTNKQNKKFLLLLSYQQNLVLDACAGKPRQDRQFIDELNNTRIRYVDILPKHVEDFKKFNLTPKQYGRHYYIGHYKPSGNHFFAFAIKNEIVDWLNPKPPAYQNKGRTVRFEGYLPS